jgi:uncharacterized glyoxalase superfamily protein PhnB
MATIDSLVLDVPDSAAAEAFYDKAFGLGDTLACRESSLDPAAYRGFTLSLVVSQPGTVDALTGSAVDAGATILKEARKSFWGYGSALRAPDGTVWTIATSAKKDTGPANRDVDSVVLLLGALDVRASKRFYVERGMAVGKGFGGKYVEFDTPGSAVKLALYGRRGLAKQAGIDPRTVDLTGTGPHGITVVGDLGTVTDPDGFAWTASVPAHS